MRQPRDRFAALGLDPVASAPDEFAAQIRREIVKWGKVIRDANIRMERGAGERAHPARSFPVARWRWPIAAERERIIRRPARRCCIESRRGAADHHGNLHGRTYLPSRRRHGKPPRVHRTWLFPGPTPRAATV
jgi:hypothetical protein